MVFLFLILLPVNGMSEYLLKKMMVTIDVIDKKYRVYYFICAVLRIMWLFSGARFAVPLPLLLTGLFILLFLSAVPYSGPRPMIINFSLIIYLIYASLLMAVIGSAGLFGFDMEHLAQDAAMRGAVMITALMAFNVICMLLLHYQPEFLWRENYDKSKIVIYTCFLFLCFTYHILDAVILTLYPVSRVNCLLLVSGDVLILFLVFNFLKYNYVFAKSRDIKREYEESEVLIAQRYFEKKALKELSGFDTLTHAFNRREISHIMEKGIRNGHSFVCVFLDLDGLKQANDTYGHAFGDTMLKRFADTCMELIRGNGNLARIGGDEFLLVFPDAQIGSVETLLGQLRAKLLEQADEKDQISFSYGISHGETTVDGYINKADQQMYADKNRKRCGQNI